MRTVAALYVLARGPYAAMEGVDAWPERRDALLYDGEGPVVAHPPCGPWSNSGFRQLTKLSATQGPWLAPNAVLQVRRHGGVLEHPQRSHLWGKMSLPYPEPYRQTTIAGPERDAWGGFTVELDQSAWGHKYSHKRSWIYCVGIDYDLATTFPPPVALPRIDEPAHWKPKLDSRRPGKTYPRCGMDIASPEQKKRSPDAFACWLVALARTAQT